MSSIKHNLASARTVFGEWNVNLISVPQKGLYIDATDKQREEINNMLLQIANHSPVSERFRRDYIFETVFGYQGNYTVQLLAEELYVSRNVISKDLKWLNEFLEKFHVKIGTKKNKGIIVKGHEFEIRQALILYNNQKWWEEAYQDVPEGLDIRLSKRAWTYLSNFYSKSVEEILEIQKALHAMEEQLGMVFTDISFGRLMEYLIITRERIRQKKYILSYIREGHLPIEKSYLWAAELFLASYIGEDDECWKYERCYLAARLCEAAVICGRKPTGIYHDRIEEYLEEVKNAVGGYGSTNSNELIDNVEELITTIRYRENYRIYDWTDLAKDIKKRFAGLYAVCMMRIYILEEPVGLKFLEDDIARIVLLIHNHMRKRRKEVVFVTAANQEESYYHLEKLKEEFPYLYFRKVVNYQDFRPAEYEGSLVISTVVVRGNLPNVICITKHVDESDIWMIRERLGANKIYNRKILERVFTEEQIYDITVKNKEDALKQIVDRMTKQGCVENGFLNEILSREKTLSTCIGNKVAIPHAYRKHVIRSSVAVARLKNSVDWFEEERADLIFLFAIGDESSNDIKELFSHMYNLLTEDEKIKRIKEASDKEEIIQLILKCE